MKKIFLSLDKFVLATIFVILFSYFFYSTNSTFNTILEWISTIGIALIFFFYGLKLSPEKLKNGLKNWKLHLVVQCSTFFIFPCLVLPFYFLFNCEESRLIWLAFLFLAALPSTVSSSVVFVSIAKGNLAAAIFNASISGLIGILVTPLWIGLFLSNTSGNFDLSSIYLKLIVEIVLPVMLGLLLQKNYGKYAIQHSARLALFDKSIILLIIYRSFADAFANNIFSSVEIIELILVGIAVVILFFVMYFITGKLANIFGFHRADKITTQFCGTKKSLVHGTVFSKILFPVSFPTGIILLPLMLFHSFQIFVITIIATRLSKDKSSIE